MEKTTSDNTRNYNIGSSDYSKHKYQSWDFWLTYCLNPFDADLSKRTLRIKASDGRKMDYEKIHHICDERIRQLRKGKDKWGLPKKVPVRYFNEMIADYNLCEADKSLMLKLLYPSKRIGNVRKARINDYREVQCICKERILELEETERAIDKSAQKKTAKKSKKN